MADSRSESFKPVEDQSFPEPEDKDFDDDIEDDEKEHYKKKYKDLSKVKKQRLHCTACDRHLGCAPKSDSRMRTHPLLRTLVCRSCHSFYNSGEFEKGEDGSELYCRWCGQGGQVYCCSDCPHVFCAKCIKRNLGAAVIKDIESADDWKCFKCSPTILWDLRATCWAILRYCDLKNKKAYLTQDPELKEKLSKECALDESDCCRKNVKRSVKTPTPEKIIERKTTDKRIEDLEKNKKAMVAIQKMPGIQVKKFAAVKADNGINNKSLEIKGVKRPAPAIIAKGPFRHPVMYPTSKKAKIPIAPAYKLPIIPSKNIIKLPQKLPQIKGGTQTFLPIYNGNMNNYMQSCDTLNLSLESLTQGLDMNAVAALASQQQQEDDVVCTPDLPLEPMCELEEEDDGGDDDVQCITPASVPAPKPATLSNTIKFNHDNIVQMTENDVTVNSVTGGLKFRVDPQTLSANKMYRLPDGRVFAINPNPKMPGGYSATIVAMSDNQGKATGSRGVTYAAKLSAVKPANQASQRGSKKRKTANSNSNNNKATSASVEWFKFGIIESTDCMNYSLERISKMKAQSAYLKTRSKNEMRDLYHSFNRVLTTSIKRFNEIKEALEVGYAKYCEASNLSDDDVEILGDVNPDPIPLDENSDVEVNDTNDCDKILDISDTEELESREKEECEAETIIPDKVDEVINSSTEIMVRSDISVSKEKQEDEKPVEIKAEHKSDESETQNEDTKKDENGEESVDESKSVDKDLKQDKEIKKDKESKLDEESKQDKESDTEEESTKKDNSNNVSMEEKSDKKVVNEEKAGENDSSVKVITKSENKCESSVEKVKDKKECKLVKDKVKNGNEKESDSREKSEALIQNGESSSKDISMDVSETKTIANGDKSEDVETEINGEKKSNELNMSDEMIDKLLGGDDLSNDDMSYAITGLADADLVPTFN